MSVIDISIQYAGHDDFKLIRHYDVHLREAELTECIRLKRVLTMRAGDVFIGWLRYNMFWDSIPFVNMLYLLKKYRRQGFGKKLLEYWENEMMKNGCKIVMTSTLSNEKAQFFYRKNGYFDCGSLLLPGEPLEIILMKTLI